MSIDSRVLSASHESLFGGLKSILLFETYAQLQRRSKVSKFCSLHRDFNEPGRVKGLFRLHYLKPPFNGFFNVGNSFFVSLPLRKTSRKSGNLCYIISLFVLFNYHMQFHIISSCFHFMIAMTGLSSIIRGLREIKSAIGGERLTIKRISTQ